MFLGVGFSSISPTDIGPPLYSKPSFIDWFVTNVSVEVLPDPWNLCNISDLGIVVGVGLGIDDAPNCFLLSFCLFGVSGAVVLFFFWLTVAVGDIGLSLLGVGAAITLVGILVAVGLGVDLSETDVLPSLPHPVRISIKTVDSFSIVSTDLFMWIGVTKSEQNLRSSPSVLAVLYPFLSIQAPHHKLQSYVVRVEGLEDVNPMVTQEIL